MQKEHSEASENTIRISKLHCFPIYLSIKTITCRSGKCSHIASGFWNSPRTWCFPLWDFSWQLSSWVYTSESYTWNSLFILIPLGQMVYTFNNFPLKCHDFKCHFLLIYIKLNANSHLTCSKAFLQKSIMLHNPGKQFRAVPVQ